MGFFTLEHSTAAYRADFAISGIAVGGLSIVLLANAPRAQGLGLLAIVAGGLLSWTLLEYLIHRFLLHGVEPFRRWHGEHHHRPGALIYTPTVLVAATIFSFVFLPAWWLGGVWRATAITLGVLVGNLAYAVTHHATHHWRARSAWMKHRKQWHALHHHATVQPGCFGVTSAFWDHVFASSGPARREPGRARNA